MPTAVKIVVIRKNSLYVLTATESLGTQRLSRRRWLPPRHKGVTRLMLIKTLTKDPFTYPERDLPLFTCLWSSGIATEITISLDHEAGVEEARENG